MAPWFLQRLLRDRQALSGAPAWQGHYGGLGQRPQKSVEKHVGHMQLLNQHTCYFSMFKLKQQQLIILMLFLNVFSFYWQQIQQAIAKML